MKKEFPKETHLLSEFVYNRRKYLGLSQRAVAQRAGVSQPVISDLESCAKTTNWANCLRILKALDTSLSEYAAWERSILTE